MIVLDRRDAGRFRAAVRRCVAGRPRGLAPPVHLRQTKGVLTLSAFLEEVAIALRSPVPEGPPAHLVVPWAALNALEGNGGGVATVEEAGEGHLRCRWTERGEARELECPSAPQGPQQADWPVPRTMAAVDPALLAALHACGQAAGRSDNGGYALARLQLRGRAGDVVGTDGRQLLLWGGFAFPFADDALVPAVPVFGGRELVGEKDVGIGRAPQHVVVAAGPWTVWLAMDTAARFPDVAAVLPRSPRAARMVIGDADAEAVLGRLAETPATGEEPVPVTLSFGPRPLLRAPVAPSAHAAEVDLPHSRCWGPAVAVTLDRHYLARALSLGLREVRATAPQAPILFRDERRTYLVAGLDPRATAEPCAAGHPPAADPPSPRPPSRGGDDPVNPERNVRPPAEDAPADDALDPLAEAEELRGMLVGIGRRVNRLILCLRQLQKQRRALQSAWASLQHLHLGPKGGS